MKLKHYANIGTAKSGSTWLFENLLKSNAIDYNKEKEIKYNIFLNEKNYTEYFKKFNFSLNFQVASWGIDLRQISFIKRHSTHCSIILRNPYQFLDSFYNFIKVTETDGDSFVESIADHIRYADMLKRWHDHDNFKIFYYDHMCSNSQNYLNSVTDYLNIDRLIALGAINKTSYIKNINLNHFSINQIEQEITKLEDFLQKDFSHWRKK